MGPTDPTAATVATLLAKAALVTATVLVGLAAGFFYTYEASVTVGLAEVGDPAYVETFQAINDTVRNPIFGIVFFGSIPAVVVALAVNWGRVAATGRTLLVAALALYLGGLAVTGTGNVPLNNDLAEVASLAPASAAAARTAFEDEWNRLNLIRALAVGTAFVALATTLVLDPARKTPVPGNGARESDEGPAMDQNR